MLSNRQKKRFLAAAIKEKARVHVGRDGIRPRVLRAYREAYEGSQCHPGAREIVRVKIHPTCQLSDQEIVDALTGSYPSEYIGRQQEIFMVFGKIDP